jgi:hypothetical protein
VNIGYVNIGRLREVVFTISKTDSNDFDVCCRVQILLSSFLDHTRTQGGNGMVKRACTAALIALWLPGSALAQVEEVSPPPPPAALAPPPAVPAPPQAVPAPPPAAPARGAAPPAALPAPAVFQATRYSRYRTSWYLGFSVGGGGGWVSDDRGYRSESEGGVALQLRVGWVARPWLLIGAELSGWRHDEQDYWVQFTHLDAMATLFPFYDRGFYGKAGVGAGVATLGDIHTSGAGSIEGRSEVGGDLKLGLGYEWQLGSSLTLGGDLSYALTVYEEGRTHDLTAQLTLTWY